MTATPYDYLITLCIMAAISLLIYIRYEVELFKNIKHTFAIFGIFIVVGYVWDTFGVRRRFWTYPDGHNIGLMVGGLPVEEYMFYIVIPFFIIVLYRAISKAETKRRARRK